jgi:hypothetical protein
MIEPIFGETRRNGKFCVKPVFGTKLQSNSNNSSVALFCMILEAMES